MLKAVRFDEVQHKQLLNFIKDYRDNKGRINESEAIRLLMQRGLESLQQSAIEPTPVVNQDNEIDINMIKQELLSEIAMLIPQNKEQPSIEQIKKELYNDVLSEINNRTLNNLNSIVDKISNLQPIVIQQEVKNETPTEPQTIPEINNIPNIPVKKIDIPGDTDGLLGNLLSNANR